MFCFPINKQCHAQQTYIGDLFPDKIEELDVNVIYPILEKFGGWPTLGSNPGGGWDPTKFHLMDTLVKMSAYGHNPFIDLYVGLDLKKPDTRILYVS